MVIREITGIPVIHTLPVIFNTLNLKVIKRISLILFHIITICIVTSCNNQVELNEEKILNEAFDQLRTKIDFPENYFVSPIRSKFEFNYFGKTELKHTSDFSIKVRDSVLNRINWNLEDFNRVKKQIDTMTFTNVSGFSKGNSSCALFCVSPIQSNLFFIQKYEAFEKFTYSKLSENDIPEFDELTTYLSLIVTLKNNKVDKIFMDDLAVFNCF